MNGRERYLRALTFQKPDRPPLMHHMVAGGLRVHGHDLEALYQKYPCDVLHAPLYGNEGSRGDFAFHDHPRGLGRLNEVSYDDWKCGWLWNTSDYMGLCVENPLEDWAAFEDYSLPDPMNGDEGVAYVEEMARRDDRQHFIFVDAGELFQRMWFLRGYENSLIDLIDQPPELFALRDMIVDFNIARIRRWHESGVVDGFIHRDDWGTNTALMADPEIWRNVFKPAYQQIVDAIHEGDSYASFHIDGFTSDILGDLVDIGWDEVNPQVHLMGIEELGKALAGKVCVRADIDRQWTLPFGEPGDVRALVERIYDAFGRQNGGYVGWGEAAADVPLANLEAMFEVIYAAS